MNDTPRGYTPRELAKILRVGPDKVRALIHSGELGAINTATVRCGKPRFVVLPHHLAQFEQGRRISPAAKPTPRPKRRRDMIDYFA
jgi:excisionase family DNA binding protein